MKSQDFDNVLIGHEKVAWDMLKKLKAGLFGKTRSETYEDDVKKMLDAFQKLKVNMSLKIHYLHYHLDYFGAQLATESDEQGERYHQTAMPTEKRYVLKIEDKY